MLVMMMMMMMNCFVVWLSNERRSALLFLAETIVRDPQHRKSPTNCEQGLNLSSGLRTSLMKLCSRDNGYTTAPFHRIIA